MQRYPHWVRYDRHSLDLDFREYKKKEEAKWRSRADRYGFRFPIFDSKEHLESELESSPIVQIDKIGHVGNKTVNSSIEDIETLGTSGRACGGAGCGELVATDSSYGPMKQEATDALASW